jgi:hypothetical protein
MSKFAKHHIINYIWYLEYEQINDNTIHIISHWRIHQGVGEHPQTEDQFRLKEDANRTVIGATINEIEFKVDNPKHVFDYNINKT